MKFSSNDPLLKERRKILRNNSTKQEVILWGQLNQNRLGVKFRRQFGIGPYIIDFYNHEHKLVIELDGSQHYKESGLDYDKERDNYLASLGFRVIRFSNYEIDANLESVLLEIKKYI